MKNISLVLNAVLLLAVGALFYLHFADKKKATPSYIAPSAAANDGIKIAHVNIDTLDAKYEWLKQQKDALEKSMKSKQSALEAKKSALEKEYQAFMEKAQSGQMTQADAQKTDENFMKRGQALAQEEERMSKQLSDEYKKAMDNLNSNVEAKLKSLHDQIGYDYILSYSKGGGQVLFANDSLEITNQVLELLNAKEEQK